MSHPTSPQPLVPQNSPPFPIAGDRLNEKQLAAVDLLAVGKPYGESARILGIDRKTLYNWRNDDLFQEALQNRRAELWQSAADRIRALLHPSIDILEKHLTDTYDRSRFRAATTILRLSSRSLFNVRC
jgi:DNA-binding CsgD family transcriptional regulator